MLKIQPRFSDFWEHRGDSTTYVVISGFIATVACCCFLIIGTGNYFYHSYHHQWALHLLQIAPALFFLPFLLYSLAKWKITWSWMPFAKRTRLWTGVPLNLWVLLSVLWCCSYPVLLSFYIGQSLIHMFRIFVISFDGTKGMLSYVALAIWLIMKTVAIGCYTPNGSATARIKKMWREAFSKQKPIEPPPAPVESRDDEPALCEQRNSIGVCNDFFCKCYGEPCAYTLFGQIMCQRYISRNKKQFSVLNDDGSIKRDDKGQLPY